jgi:hypothetical protein
MARMKRLPRPSKLRLPTKKRIARNLCKKADIKYYLLFLTVEVYFMVSIKSLRPTENLFNTTTKNVDPVQVR